MPRRSCLLLAFALLACRSESSDPSTNAPEVAIEVAVEVAVEQPGHLLLPWGAELYAAPQANAFRLRIGVADDPAAQRPAVAVIGREGAYWKVETVDDEALRDLAVPAIEGLDVYALHLYVPIGVGDPIPPRPAGSNPPVWPMAVPSDARAQALADANGFVGVLDSMSSNPRLQSGDSRSPDSWIEFRVSPSEKVYWTDGREAGTVRTEHAFAERCEGRASEAGALCCFVVRVGPYVRDEGDLCFAEASVRRVSVVPELVSPFGEQFVDDENPDLWDDDHDVSTYGPAGLGPPPRIVSADDDATIVEANLRKLSSLPRGYWLPRVGRAKVTGAMDPDIARRIVRAHANEVRACWSGPGGIDITLKVDKAGKVTSSKARTIDPAVELCVEQAAATWRFPKSFPGSLSLTIGLGDPAP